MRGSPAVLAALAVETRHAPLFCAHRMALPEAGVHGWPRPVCMHAQCCTVESCLGGADDIAQLTSACAHMDKRSSPHLASMPITLMCRGREAAVGDLSQQRQQLAEMVTASAAADRDHGSAMLQMRAQLDAAKEGAQRQARDAAARAEQLAAERDDARQRCFESCPCKASQPMEHTRLLSYTNDVGSHEVSAAHAPKLLFHA